MCGIAGFQNVTTDSLTRAMLTYGLGAGVDTRGGHAIGFTSVDADGLVTMLRRPGRWTDASARFTSVASRGDSVSLHARYATCGIKHAEDHAHPFPIKRTVEGKTRTVLWGMHNGIIYNARESARAHKRDYTVDSRELFELLADGESEKIAGLEGYGTISWHERVSPHDVWFDRLTASGELEIAKIKSGGLVWGSTRSIVESAVKIAALEVEHFYEIKHGLVHNATGGKLFVSEAKLVIDEFAKRESLYLTSGGSVLKREGWAGGGSRRRFFDDDDDYDDLFAKRYSSGQVDLVNWNDKNDANDDDDWWDDDDPEDPRSESYQLEHEFLVEEICGLYGMHPSVVQDMTNDQLRESLDAADSAMRASRTTRDTNSPF